MRGPTLLVLLLSFAFIGPALAHGVTGGDAAFLEASRGMDLGPYLYLGAKHMFTGYDHLLFLLSVLFYVFRLKDVVIYITLFSLGHSATLLFGVLTGLHLDAYLVDAVIGLSVVYKALDNLGGVKALLGFVPNQRAMVLAFGLVHGFGLATKLQDINLSPEGLLANMLAFNVGVELGQLSALAFILTALAIWRAQPSFSRQAAFINVLIMAAGFALTAIQLIGFWSQV